MDCSLPGSSVHVISQARLLENGLPFSSPGDLPNIGIQPQSSALASRFFTTELPGKPLFFIIIFINPSFLEQIYIHSKMRRRNRDSSYTLSPIINILHQSGSFINNEPTVTHHYQQKSIVYIRVLRAPLDGYIFYRFG